MFKANVIIMFILAEPVPGSHPPPQQGADGPYLLAGALLPAVPVSGQTSPQNSLQLHRTGYQECEL